MSVDANALERETLERKDRDELQKIAGALGGKVTSRTRKADIIDMILELTGVTSSESSADDAADESSDAPANGRSGAQKSEPQRSEPQKSAGAKSSDCDTSKNCLASPALQWSNGARSGFGGVASLTGLWSRSFMRTA